MPPVFRHVALAAAQAAFDKKAEHLVLYYVGASHPLADFLLIMTALSDSHMDTLQHAVEETLKTAGLRPLRRARPESDQWKVLDYGDLVVHIMTQASRDFYRLERLYGNARKIHFTKRPTRGPAPFTPKPARPS
ncbi:MAG: ribosome silencing factor [Elusimicrobia bacterium]|nr:ribosome silencing factor [Elusimicrobiota bacterium]